MKMCLHVLVGRFDGQLIRKATSCRFKGGWVIVVMGLTPTHRVGQITRIWPVNLIWVCLALARVS